MMLSCFAHGYKKSLPVQSVRGFSQMACTIVLIAHFWMNLMMFPFFSSNCWFLCPTGAVFKQDCVYRFPVVMQATSRTRQCCLIRTFTWLVNELAVPSLEECIHFFVCSIIVGGCRGVVTPVVKHAFSSAQTHESLI